MRYKLVILIPILLLIFCSSAIAEDVVLGTVISADEQSRKLVVRPIGQNNKDTLNITVIMGKNFRWDQIEVGSVVRVWGSSDTETIFRGTKISSENFRFRDPTGVRFRLQMGANPMKIPPPPRPR